MRNFKAWLTVLAIVFLAGCVDSDGPPIESPSGQYVIRATVNGTDESRAGYFHVMIHLMDASGTELEVYRSRAGDAMKWALGWMPDEDIVILQSSDVGDMAFEIQNERLVEIPDLSDAMKARAAALKAERYGTPNKANAPNSDSAVAPSE